MTPQRFTDEQQRAVDRRDGSLLVAAGAGSGKTSVLVERVARAIVDDGVAPEAILAITFTEKAAAEVRVRLRARLNELGGREAALGAETAWISTIHGFCARVLREHSLAAGLDPRHEVLDALGAEQLAMAAFDQALAEFLAEGDPERLDLAAAYSPDRLAQMVRGAYGHLRSKGQEPVLPPVEPPDYQGELEALAAAAAAAAAHLGGCDLTKVTVGKALAKAEATGALLADRSGDDLPEVAALEDVKPGKPGNTGAFQHDSYTAWTGAWEALHDYLAAFHDLAVRDLIDEILRLYGTAYAELKRARSALDFDDLELGMRDLLVAQPAIRRALAARFEHVLVDEFQDTNELQNEIVELVSRDNVFRVGDARQSIYRFRHADVRVFETYAERAAAEDRFEPLTTNFRSRGEILDAVGRVFGSIWGESFQPLREGPAARAEPPRAGVAVELLMTDMSTKEFKDPVDELALAAGEPFGDALSDATRFRAAEARLLARRVAELTGPEGPWEPRDVVLLLRATTFMHTYERALQDAGLATYVVGGRGYWGQQQVADLRAWLGVLANPLDGVALYQALASPLGGVSLDSLVLIAEAARAPGYDPWRVVEEGGADVGGEDAHRLRDFAERVAADRLAAPRIPLEALIDRAITASGYDRHVLASPAGERRMANVRKLMRVAREFEATEGRDLRAFIDFVAERDVLDNREGEAPLETEGVDAVRLMTVHRAKGLEFPVVCLADLGKSGREDHRELRIGDDGELGIRHARLGGGRFDGAKLQALKELQKIEDEEEERRVFYVGMTRAEHHLILSGATDLTKLDEPKPLCEPMRWIWRGLVGDPLAAAEAGTVAVEHGGRSFDLRCEAVTFATLDERLPAADRNPPPPEPEPAGLEALNTPALAAVPVPPPLAVSRLSYSGIADYGRCGYRFYLRRSLGLPDREQPGAPAPEFEGLPATVIGGVVHQLLERIDVAAPRVPSSADIEARLAGYGTATGAELDRIREFVEGFIDSPLRERLAACDRVRTELGFAFELGPLLLNGFVDVYATEPDRTLIVDYKTNKLGERSVEDAAEDYETQRIVYALAALRAGAERVEVLYMYLERPEETVSKVYESADMPELERRLEELAAGITAGDFSVTDTPGPFVCEACPGRGTLCSHPLEKTFEDAA